jgi:hypothetical protein
LLPPAARTITAGVLRLGRAARRETEEGRFERAAARALGAGARASIWCFWWWWLHPPTNESRGLAACRAKDE